MLIQPLQNLTRILRFLGILVLAATTSSCNHAEASRANASEDVIMQVIRDYGRGHQSLLTPANFEKPDEYDDIYSAHIRNILVQEDFAQLEKIAQRNRVEKGRLIGGVWKILGYYDGTGWPVDEGKPKESDWQLRIATLKKWIAASPNSTAARLSLAYLYVNYSWVARGVGFSDSVSDDQWKLFYERTAQAKSLLLEISSFKDKDPFWYEVMQLVARNEGWDKTQVRELFDQAVSFEPGYYHFYVEYSGYLQPQWYGKPGDIQALADEISQRLPEPDGSMFYFWILANRACYCRQALDDLPNASYEKFNRGYSNIIRLYGVSNLNANRFAFIAATFHDQSAAREAFANITKIDENIWSSQSIFDKYREWASTP
jgi:hypothetical protein